MISLPEKLIFPTPFAGGEGAALTPIKQSSDINKVNFSDGFPSVYSSPNSLGGKYVTRGELNAIGNLATKNDYYRMCGGINTFDPEFAYAIGGYPKDAILDYFDGVNLFKVISLEEDNMVDFRSGVFGGKWAKLGTNDVLQGSVIVGSIEGGYKWSMLDVYPIGVFTALKTGIVSIRQKSLSFPALQQSTRTDTQLAGCGILCRVFDSVNNIVYPSVESSSEFDYENYSQISTFSSLSQIDPPYGKYKYTALNLKRTPVEVRKGQYISICLQNGGYADPANPATNNYTDVTLTAGVYID